jgi:hypothetical protein
MKSYSAQVEKGQAIGATLSYQKKAGRSVSQLINNRPTTNASVQHQIAIDNAPRVRQLKTRQMPLDSSGRVQQLKARNTILAAGLPMEICQRSVRATVVQRAADMDVPRATLLHKIRKGAEQLLWTNHSVRNSEIQVGLQDMPNQQRVVTVGWNVGGTTSVNAAPVGTEQDLQVLLQENGIAGNGITQIKLVKTNKNNGSAAMVDNRAIHAEGIIIAESIKAMLVKIKNGEELEPVVLSIFGKKAACKSCGSAIKDIVENAGMKEFITIQTASDEVFNQATGEEATHGSQQSAWINPLHLISKNEIIEAREIVLKAGPRQSPKGLHYDKLLYFLRNLEELVEKPNPA